MSKDLHIVELSAENFMRLKAVRIRFDGDKLQLVTGRNAQGKSSVLNAIYAALGGKDAVPGKPVRKGAESAEVTLDLGDIKVRRTFHADKTTLTVENAEGLRYKSPQTILSELWDRMSVDPLAFSRMPMAQQSETIRKMVGLDTLAIDTKYAQAFETRSAIGREIRRCKGAVDTMPKHPEDTPEDFVSLKSISDELRAASDTNHDNATKRGELHAATARLDGARNSVKSYEADIERAEAALARLRGGLADAQRRLATVDDDTKRIAAEVAQLKDVDVSAISTKLGDAERTNANVRLRQRRIEAEAELQRHYDDAAEQKKILDACDAEKAAMLAAVAAKFPIPGLSLEGETVTWQGIPLDQASSAEQLRVGLAVGAALHPRLRAVLVRDGSLLDDEGIKIVAQWAAENDMQVIMERVADGKHTGIVIEDGEVAQ